MHSLTFHSLCFLICKVRFIVCVCVSLSVVSDSATPWALAHQVPISMGFSRQAYWSSYSLLQGIFPTKGSNPSLLHGRQILYRLSHQGSPSFPFLFPHL